MTRQIVGAIFANLAAVLIVLEIILNIFKYKDYSPRSYKDLSFKEWKQAKFIAYHKGLPYMFTSGGKDTKNLIHAEKIRLWIIWDYKVSFSLRYFREFLIIMSIACTFMFLV